MVVPRIIAALLISATLLSCRDTDPTTLEPSLEVRLGVRADTLLVGDSVMLEASVVNRETGQTVAAAVTWISSDTTIAAVNAAGRVLARHAGTARVTARAGNASEHADIFVDSAAQIRLSRTTATLTAEDTLSLSAEVLGSSGAVFALPVQWMAADTSIAVVSPTGQITARNPGTTSITASYNRTHASATVTVNAPVLRVVTCSDAGVTHRGSIGTETWTAGASPHYVADSVKVTGTLTIEPGATICGMPGATLRITGELSAVGTRYKPITIKATDSAKHWGGFGSETSGPTVGATINVAHALIEYGAVWVGPYSIATVSDSHFRHSAYYASSNFSMNSLYRSVVDSADVWINAGGTFEQSIIRGGGLVLFMSNVPGTTRLNGGRIENSPGIALAVGNMATGRSPTIEMGKPIRIVGNRGYAVEMSVSTFLSVWSSIQAQDSLLGGVNDTLSLYNSGGSSAYYAHLRIRRQQPWRLSSLTTYMDVDTLTMEPGSSLDIARVVLRLNAGSSVIGTPQSPITIKSTATLCYRYGPCGLVFADTATTRLSHVDISRVYFDVIEQHKVQIDHVNANFFMWFASAGSTIEDLSLDSVDGGALDPHAALRLSGPNIRAERIRIGRTAGASLVFTTDSAGKGISTLTPRAAVAIEASGVQVLACTVADNADDGIRVLSGAGVGIHDCNLERNGGYGVINQGTAPVDAQRNWWGDRAGPLGFSGDGVWGNVDYSGWYPSRR